MKISFFLSSLLLSLTNVSMATSNATITTTTTNATNGTVDGDTSNNNKYTNTTIGDAALTGHQQQHLTELPDRPSFIVRELQTDFSDFCSLGLRDGRVCCPAQCGKCGGPGCNTRPGGGDLCCFSTIFNRKIGCKHPTSTNCIVPKLDDGVTCVDDDYCQSGRCETNFKTCQARLPNSLVCQRDEDCLSDRCKKIRTNLSRCEDKLSNGKQCLRGADCLSGRCRSFGNNPAKCRAK